MYYAQILQNLNFVAQCRKHGLPLWQCPSFLFLLMGVIVIGSTTSIYIIASFFTDEPLVAALIVVILSIILFVIGQLVVQSFERISSAARAKSEFIAVASHQLRSPLSAVKWSLNLLLSGKVGKLGNKQKEYLQIIQENNQRMVELANKLLNVNRLEAGKFRLQVKLFSLTDLTAKVIKNLSPLVKTRNISLEFASPKKLPLAKADPERIEDVIQNLLDNAIKYIRGKGKINITLSRKDHFLKLTITDTGVGIPEEQKNQIFRKFFRSSNVMKHETGGSGLGLFIAKAIIEKSGGKINFESKEGKGSSFWFTLPIKR